VNKNSRKAPRSSQEIVSRRTKVLRVLGLVSLALSTAAAGLGLGQQAQQPAAAAPETQTLHVLVGKSVLINLEARVKRVMVSNPSVIDATVTSPTQVVVTAKGAGTSSLILWDQADRSRMLDVLVDVDVSSLRDAIQQAYPTEPIQVQAEEGRVIISGTVSDSRVADDVVKMAGSFAQTVINSTTLAPPRHEKQILLEVKFAEVDRVKLEQLGWNIFSTGALNTPAAISTGQFSPPISAGSISGSIGGKAQAFTTTFTVQDLLNIFLFRPDINLGTTIRDLQTKSVLEILAEPNLLALPGKPARFLAGGEFPFPVVQGGTNFSAVTIQFRPFGVRLEFTGFITDNDIIRLQVTPEVSTLDFANALTISGFVVPAISTRRAETEIELRDGQGFGIAGMLDQRTQAQLNKVPGIGDIPVLGQLFRSRSTNRSRNELLVLVTPRIVDPLKAGAPAPVPPKLPMPNLSVPGFDQGMPQGEKAGKAPEKAPQP
jgi:pilus assembly protein CpaC